MRMSCLDPLKKKTSLERNGRMLEGKEGGRKERRGREKWEKEKMKEKKE